MISFEGFVVPGDLESADLPGGTDAALLVASVP
jgi:hypothetical protein